MMHDDPPRASIADDVCLTSGRDFDCTHKVHEVDDVYGTQAGVAQQLMKAELRDRTFRILLSMAMNPLAQKANRAGTIPARFIFRPDEKE
jgi:hypothetical protein